MSSNRSEQMQPYQFQFKDPGELRDKDLWLSLDAMHPADEIKKWVPYYHFTLHLDGVKEPVGTLDFRAAFSENLSQLGGYIGYAVKEQYRGQRLAERACRLLLPFIKSHEFKELWITTTPENIASRRTLERLGASMIEIVDVPQDSDMYALGERQKCRYRLVLEK